MEKAKYVNPEVEIVYIDDVVVTSSKYPDGGDFIGTAPDFVWGNEEDGWPTFDDMK